MSSKIRYNAKARSSVAGDSHKKKKRKLQNGAIATVDSNAEILPTESVQERSDRKQQLKAEIAAQLPAKSSSKKMRRVEKYIDKKLQQEERVALLQKLAKSQSTGSDAMRLTSSATLGTRNFTSNEDTARRLQNRIRFAAATNGSRKRRRLEPLYDSDSSVDDDDDRQSVASHGSTSAPPDNKAVVERQSIDTPKNGVIISQSVPAAPAVGSALRRNEDGSVAAPTVRVRKKRKNQSQVTLPTLHKPHAEPSESSFDSSNSDNDTLDDGDDEEASSWAGFSDADDRQSQNSSASSSEDETSKDQHETLQPPRKSFKDWANQQIAKARQLSSEPEPLTIPTQAVVPIMTSRARLDEMLGITGPTGEVLPVSKEATAKLAQFKCQSVNVNRPKEIQEARLKLPILVEEQNIVEEILLNSVVIICGETGSGKTTQLPQFLYEAGFATSVDGVQRMIGITQPRRVAAVAMAARVSGELALPPASNKVAYQIRYDATTSSNTAIKFMTDGVLLRELSTDFLLRKYSVIIIDEAHERSMNTDVLIGALSRIVNLREKMANEGEENIEPLRLVIMSATLRVQDFAENRTLFASLPPIINVPARQHPVAIHFARRTSPDYISEAIKKVSKIHERLPAGGIIIFLTGQNEITGVCRRLRQKYGSLRSQREHIPVRSENVQHGVDLSIREHIANPEKEDVEVEGIDLGISRQETGLDDGDLLDDEDAASSDDGLEAIEGEISLADSPMHILPLYSLLDQEKQMQIFEKPPDGHRLVVVATNVAETSLTIPGIKYVVDCGRVKERKYDPVSGVQSFEVGWISKASSAQRAGRAGRTGPGHCYCLYSSALFEQHFKAHTDAEILRMPIDGVVLQMKGMHIDAVVNFPFPTPPDRDQLRLAEKRLGLLGALEANSISSNIKSITSLGSAMALFPLSPRFSKMLISGRQHGCLHYVVTIVSALSVGDPFIDEGAVGTSAQVQDSALDGAADDMSDNRRRDYFQKHEMHSKLGNGSSDMFRLLSLMGAYEFGAGGFEFCREHFVHLKAMEEIRKLRGQISRIVVSNFPETSGDFVPKLKPPSDTQLKILKQLLAAGFIDQVAVRADLVGKSTDAGTRYRTTKGVAYRALGVSEDVFIHPSSILYSRSPPDWVVYQQITRTTRLWMKNLTVVNPAWLPALAPQSLCTFSKTVKPDIFIPRFGPEAWELPPMKRPVPL